MYNCELVSRFEILIIALHAPVNCMTKLSIAGSSLFQRVSTTV